MRHTRRRILQAQRLAAGAAATAAVLALGAAPAHADTFRTATESGWGPTMSAGRANAEANARAALNAQAAQAGETCPSVTTTSTHVYTAPDGSAYVFSATASGTCVPQPQPAYTVPRSATRQGGGTSSTAAIQAGSQAARADILAAGVACANWSTTSTPVYTAPGGAWYIYNVTVSAMCTN